jgi:hypothetical protein
MKINISSGLVASFVIATSFLTSCDKESVDTPDQETVIRPVTAQSSAYVTQLFSYTPAPGQLINTPTGSNDGAKTILNGKSGLVTLGAFGGSIVLGFDHTVLNQTDKEDIIIYGNASTGFAEPGVVWVMHDTNNNGKPDDVWYELSGSVQQQMGYSTNYSITYTRPATATSDVTWKDSQGKTGVVKTNTFHKQAYYPEWITADTYTLTGTLLPSTNINDKNLSFITSNAFAYGYADNTVDGDKLDIDNAIDGKGNKVKLKGIDFVKIQTGIAYDLGWLGELSTEVKGVADIKVAGI